ncbi:Rrf2 family transcriptional regulator [Niabella pedocola]|uniref:Rrf2 family transcriptional regulator n=1 Tax=Niabella pedocola TaxID=1752077 RepID=A0ABS8PQJ1_9BACT|nr:Rrf2 family transcriptional regulator [Niabella pedocola]MCD2423316.1 Rrf2 family transcriptional regulator [Niabella pedocola]
MFSKTCEYAIRGMIYIAQHTRNGGRVGFKQIATGIDAPEHFIAKILQELSRKGLVASMKGPAGGFYLEKASLNLSLADIVTAVDGDQLFLGCGLGLKQCSETNPCPIHFKFKKVRKEVQAMLEHAKLGAFIDKLDRNETFLKRSDFFMNN